MSKIVDALRKIQDDNAVGERGHRKIARIGTNGADDSVSRDDSAELTASDINANKLISIDRDAMRDAGLIAPEAETKLIEDEYRVIKRPLLGNAFGPNAESVENGFAVLVTSALAGDGKTFTCINLALSLSREQDTSVLLVDADIPKPHISTLFDAEEQNGLLDYLDGTVDSLDEIEIATSESGLNILPAGRERANATELLTGNRMQELLESIHARDPKRIILIDSPPLLQTTEARALASTAGQIVTVVLAGVTP